MNASMLRIGGYVIGFVVLLITGYSLSRSGRPYVQILTVHKLISVAMLVFIIWSAIAANKAAGLTPAAWLVAALAALSFVILIGTGGVLSAIESPSDIIRWLHKVAPYASIPLTAIWLYLL